MTPFGSIREIDVAEAICHLTAQGTHLSITPNFWRQSFRQFRGDFDINSDFELSVSNAKATEFNAFFEKEGKSTATSIFTMKNAVPADNISVLNIKLEGARALGILPDDVLAPFRIGYVINSETLADLMYPFLYPANREVLYGCASYLELNHIYYDNTYMYAKLLHYALVKDHYDLSGVAHTAEPYADKITWVNLDQKDLSYEFINNIVLDIVLVDDYDFYGMNDDLVQLIYLLSTSGIRLSNTAHDTRGLDSRYINWEAVQVTVLMHGAAPNPPNATTLEASTVYGFAQMLACKRNEYDQLVRGLYVAMDLLGIKYNERVDVAGERHHRDHLFGTGDKRMPHPWDYNFMFRYLKVLPPPCPRDCIDEWASFLRHSANERFALCAVLLRVENVMATTLLAGLNITLKHIKHWLCETESLPDGDLRHILHMLYEERGRRINFFELLNDPKLTSPPYNNPGHFADSLFRVKVRGLASAALGCHTADGLYAGLSFTNREGTLTEANLTNIYSDCENENHAPRYMSAFSIAGFIKEVPYERGICKVERNLCISRLAIERRPDGQKRWHANMGSLVKALFYQPYQLNMNGWRVIQTMLNLRYLEEQPDPEPMLRRASWSPDDDVMYWSEAQEDVNDIPVWNKTFRCYEPNTFKSWSWESKEVMVPCLVGGEWWAQLAL